jgi:RNA polymerase sigma-70 factor (sigma-E family)
MSNQSDEEFDAFLAGRAVSLARMAYLLTGDHGQAEDLLQSALLKTYRHWGRVSKYDAPTAFVRRVMINELVSRRRRWREQPVASLPDRPAQAARDDIAQADTRDELWRAIGGLPSRTRAVLVLRYWEDLSEADTAAALGCSVGTVKSQASRGLARLREVFAEQASWAALPGRE